uniref:Apical endosomal glycoprotein-like n=1 Tax=Saccoglossus kowalevskii TaxID=10224 RepID=A0ABM0MID8_SACKO|nr:PREDICTED: apical endosomal glycoprotein-like [Saccoglossus kowalevskii]
MMSTDYTQIIRFWYTMYGRNVGRLNTYILQNGETAMQTPVWTRSGNQGPTWLLGEINLPLNGTFRIIFEAVLGNGIYGDIALDDITIEDAAFQCTFDSPGICGFTQEQGDHFDWTFGRGKTPTRRTGPNKDHTTNTAQGNTAVLFIKVFNT